MHLLDKAGKFSVDGTTKEVRMDDFDAVVLPGGVANPDQLRLDEPAATFVKATVDGGKPVAAICHGPLDGDRGGRRAGPPAHLVAERPLRHHQRRRSPGGRGGRGVHQWAQRAGHQPQARRPQGVLPRTDGRLRRRPAVALGERD
jgi:hypothetical protein